MPVEFIVKESARNRGSDDAAAIGGVAGAVASFRGGSAGDGPLLEDSTDTIAAECRAQERPPKSNASPRSSARKSAKIVRRPTRDVGIGCAPMKYDAVTRRAGGDSANGKPD
jgi:hypothetical protein